MIEIDEWLKTIVVENEFVLTGKIVEDYGKLSYKGIYFGIGVVSNPYLLYKYTFWWKNDEGWGSITLGNEYNTDLLRDLIVEKVGLERKSTITIIKPLEIEKITEEKEFTGGLFDFI